MPIFWLLDWPLLAKCGFAAAVVFICFMLLRYLFKDLHEGLSALETGLLNLKDREFSTTLSYDNKDELGHMCELYNETVEVMRKEKHWLYQRELLLDKITQTSPEVLFLVNDQQQIVFSNIAARHFFHIPSGLEGRDVSELFTQAPAGIQAAIEEKKEGLFSIVKHDQEPETWHMSTGIFLLNNQLHTLFILKHMTRELSRQEVTVWKKVIRVISHELNNSLGPISSMLHSGRILSSQLDEPRLGRVFETIDERIKHLNEFVQGYGKFAKIPEPQIEAVDCEILFSQLAQQWEFSYTNTSVKTLQGDPAQLEQLLINLLKNAHESQSEPEQILIEVQEKASDIIISVSDRGKGIAESRLNSVLIPFYSTKASGSGLGLALCREIIDAHHGNIALHNRDGGGLMVRLSLPRLNTSRQN
jgi:nitrogen fixation/metabolism regulation signal transduction histidine kinase